MVRQHDYARVSWFVGSGRYVLEYYNEVPLSTPGDSYHNIWENSAGPISFLGSLPYDSINRLTGSVQCTAAALWSRALTAPIKDQNLSRKEPVGFSHRMIGSTCEKGKCPWDYGALSRTQKLAIPLDRLKEWIAEVRSIIAELKACFPILGIYMRLAKASEAFLASSYGRDSMIFEIHVPKESDSTRFEQRTAVYEEIKQITLIKYQGRPHLGKTLVPYLMLH